MKHAHPIEDQVLYGLRTWAGVEDGGWHVGESPVVPGLTHRQITNALQRLRRKGEVYAAARVAPRDGVGRRRWEWFPSERT